MNGIKKISDFRKQKAYFSSELNETQLYWASFLSFQIPINFEGREWGQVQFRYLGINVWYSGRVFALLLWFPDIGNEIILCLERRSIYDLVYVFLPRGCKTFWLSHITL